MCKLVVAARPLACRAKLAVGLAEEVVEARRCTWSSSDDFVIADALIAPRSDLIHGFGLYVERLDFDLVCTGMIIRQRMS